MVTDYELYGDDAHQVQLFTEMNRIREEKKLSAVYSHAFYKADLVDGNSVIMIECYPSGEIPFLFTASVVSDADRESVEKYTGLKFNYYGEARRAS